jgi:hypothetical protein
MSPHCPFSTTKKDLFAKWVDDNKQRVFLKSTHTKHWTEYEGERILAEYVLIDYGEEDTTLTLYDSSRPLYIKIDNELLYWGENLTSINYQLGAGKWEIAPGTMLNS